MKKLIILALGVATMTSCKKAFEKINTNPNAAELASPDLLFSGASVNLVTTRAGGDLYISLALAAQTIASGGDYGWGADDVYAVSPYSTGNVWRTSYVSTAANLKQAIKFAEKSNPVKSGAIGQAKVLLAETMYETTMLFGDIPFSEAWNSEIVYPHFDNQEDVLNSILTTLDEAIVSLSTTGAEASAITGFDLFYKGDVSKWLKLANSLKFKVLMTLVDKVPSKATELQALYDANQMLSSAGDNFKMPFGTGTGNKNPKFAILEQYAGSYNFFFFANKSVIDPMLADDDPRISKFFDLGLGDTTDTYQGVESEEEADEFTSTISMRLYAATAPEYIMTYQELLFLQAEAAERGFLSGGRALAEEKYQEAILQSCLLAGVANGVASDFAATKSLTNLTDIYLQNWIDQMDRPIEAFNTWRRSGTKGNETPTLQIPRGAPNAGLMYRWEYPLDNEINPNVNAPKTKINYYEQQWFDL
ncbi:MAG TPA: SusD/RagB family nutrient-binding outer membrane lipoprotein [Edaphocola sp.]|nr:SusD/RagB family nutrient-binding outer membrane lipoprotein [Edaphocola sp.]